MQIKVERNAVYTFGGLVIIFAILTGVLGLISGDIREMSIAEVFLVAVAAAGFHFVAQVIHMLGHAIAAWMTGYPMSGVWFLYVMAMSLYPTDEPTLPARTHIQRSLGGVIAFGLLLVMVLLLWIDARDAAQWSIRYLTSFMLLNTVLLFFVSAVISDGVLFIVRKEWLPPESRPVS